MISDEMLDVLWRERTPVELLDELSSTFNVPLPLRIHIIIQQAVKLMADQADRIEAAKNACHPVASPLSTRVEMILVSKDWKSTYPPEQESGLDA